MLLTFQTQVTLVAPTASTRSRKWRQAAMKFAGSRPHEYQSPFISHQGRNRNGYPHAFACCAQAVITASWLPAAMSASVTPGGRYDETRGTAPRLRAAWKPLASKVPHSCPI